MANVTVINHLTLDGVMQSPGRPDEDTRGGFEHGGWAQANNDELMGRTLGEHMTGGPLLLGRRTYEDLYGYWPTQADSPFSDALTRTRKYVASTTLSEPLPWENSTLLSGEVPAAVAQLKSTSGADMVVMGSGELIRSLLPDRLIDRYVLLIHPLVLGTGLRLFEEGHSLSALQLVDSVTTTKGVLIATYRSIDSGPVRS
jgi:dihydrofolate reductase